MNKPLKIILLVLAALVLLVVGYLAYVLIDYHRLGDMDLEVDRQVLQPAETGREYHLLSYNIGFGAYEPDYGFFMDGGTESWAWSQERLTDNIGNIGSFLSQQHADFYLIQEVDRDSTRSYHVDEAALLREALPEYDGTWAQNYDSPFLMYPLRHPHGASVSGLMTLSAMTVDSARRVELPIENSLMKLVDLDRCYSVHRIPVAGGGELVLYNLHLSAYTSDGTIAMEQLKLLLEDMQREYDAGNWCVAGGDFNKDLLGDSAAYFGEADQEYTWAQPIPEDTFDGFNVSLIAPLDEGNPVPSCRNADGPYHQAVCADGGRVPGVRKRDGALQRRGGPGLCLFRPQPRGNAVRAGEIRWASMKAHGAACADIWSMICWHPVSMAGCVTAALPMWGWTAPGYLKYASTEGQ